MSTGIAFDGILFFPVTPFDADDRVDDELLRRHVGTTMEHGPGGVFPACGTGEFHALSTDEAAQVVRSTVETVAGRVPVVAGAGGPLGHAIGVARAAADAGADALLVLPPYLVGGPQAGLIAYRTEFGIKRGGAETILEKAGDLVCGDVFIIQGQSNAEAWTDINDY